MKTEVLHIDGFTMVKAVVYYFGGDELSIEYRYDDMSYSQVRELTSVNKRPSQMIPLILVLKGNKLTKAYYVTYTDTFYYKTKIKPDEILKWCYADPFTY